MNTGRESRKRWFPSCGRASSYAARGIVEVFTANSLPTTGLHWPTTCRHASMGPILDAQGVPDFAQVP